MKLQRIYTRLIDVYISSLALIILSPILIYTSYKIYNEDKGPIFYKQKRSGLNNIPFDMYKFRSMKVDNTFIGDKSKDNIFSDWTDKVPDDFVFKTSSSNSNITQIGILIRKYSIDEIPQFFNILKGEMTLVGPRPEIIEITNYYNDYQKNRLNVKPGITGWAQVNGRSNINHGEKIKLDLWYVKNKSVILDLKIIIMTILQVIKGKNSI